MERYKNVTQLLGAVVKKTVERFPEPAVLYQSNRETERVLSLFVGRGDRRKDLEFYNGLYLTIQHKFAQEGQMTRDNPDLQQKITRHFTTAFDDWSHTAGIFGTDYENMHTLLGPIESLAYSIIEAGKTAATRPIYHVSKAIRQEMLEKYHLTRIKYHTRKEQLLYPPQQQDESQESPSPFKEHIDAALAALKIPSPEFRGKSYADVLNAKGYILEEFTTANPPFILELITDHDATDTLAYPIPPHLGQDLRTGFVQGTDPISVIARQHVLTPDGTKITYGLVEPGMNSDSATYIELGRLLPTPRGFTLNTPFKTADTTPETAS